MNKSEFKDIVNKIHQSIRRVDEGEVRRVLNERENVLLIASVSQTKFSKLIAFFQTLDKPNSLFVWAKKGYRECIQKLNYTSIKYVDHEGKYSTESAEFGYIEESQYEVIIFCIDRVNQYKNLNLESVCSRLNHNCETIIYSFDCLDRFTQYCDIDTHIKSIEEYRKAVDNLV